MFTSYNKSDHAVQSSTSIAIYCLYKCEAAALLPRLQPLDCMLCPVITALNNSNDRVNNTKANESAFLYCVTFIDLKAFARIIRPAWNNYIESSIS